MNIANSRSARSFGNLKPWAAGALVALLAVSPATIAPQTAAAKSKSGSSGKSAGGKDDPGCRAAVTQAASLIAQKKDQEAAALLREWAGKCPHNSQLHFMLATVLLHVRADISEVEAASRQAVAADEHSIPAHMQLALILTNNNKVREAVQELKTVTELDPANYDAWQALAVGYKALNEDDLALQANTTAAELEPNALQNSMSVIRNLRQSGKMMQAATELKKILARKSISATTVQDLAAEGLLVGDYPDTVEACKRVLAKFPKSLPALKMMALANYCAGDYNAALENANQILAHAKDNSDALAIKGLSLLKLNQTTEAEEPLVQALTKQPNSSLALLGNGMYAAAKGNTDSGVEQLLMVLDCNASSAQSQGLPEPLAHLELASIYERTGKKALAADEARALAQDGRFNKEAQQHGATIK